MPAVTTTTATMASGGLPPITPIITTSAPPTTSEALGAIPKPLNAQMTATTQGHVPTQHTGSTIIPPIPSSTPNHQSLFPTLPATLPTLPPAPMVTNSLLNPISSVPNMDNLQNNFGSVGDPRGARFDWTQGDNDTFGLRSSTMPSMLNMSGVNNAQQTQDRYLYMFSQSLAANYSIRNVIPWKYDGNPNEWTEYEMLLLKASSQMSSMGFTKAAQFLEMKKTLKSVALAYIDHLPIQDESFNVAYDILRNLFSANQSRLTHLVKKLLSLEVCNPSFQSRQTLHSTVVGYLQGIRSLGVAPIDVLEALHISIIESRLDDQLKKEFFKFCAQRRDPSKPLGFNMNLNDVLNKVHEAMISQQRLKASLDLYQDTRPKFKRPPVQGATFAVVAGTPKRPQNPKYGNRPGQPSQGQKPQGNQGQQRLGQQSKIIQKCVLCKSQNEPNGQRFIHGYTLQCPLLKRGTLTNDDLIKIFKQQQFMCAKCLGPHSVRNCSGPSYLICSKDIGGKKCGGQHNWRLHSLLVNKIKRE